MCQSPIARTQTPLFHHFATTHTAEPRDLKYTNLQLTHASVSIRTFTNWLIDNHLIDDPIKQPSLPITFFRKKKSKPTELTSYLGTPRVYRNQCFRYFTTPDANTYCVCSSAVSYFPTKSSKGTCSTPTPKCTSDSFSSLQTPRTTEQVNKIQGRHTATNHEGSNTTSSKCGYCFQCPR